jgi:VanZ family protein
MITKRFVQGIAIGLIIVIAYLSLAPKPAVTASNDKLGHFIAYSVLTFFLMLAFSGYKWKSRFLFLLAVVYGSLLEMGQLWVPGRSFSTLDLAANASGAVIGAVIYGLAVKMRKDQI